MDGSAGMLVRYYHLYPLAIVLFLGFDRSCQRAYAQSQVAIKSDALLSLIQNATQQDAFMRGFEETGNHFFQLSPLAFSPCSVSYSSRGVFEYFQHIMPTSVTVGMALLGKDLACGMHVGQKGLGNKFLSTTLDWSDPVGATMPLSTQWDSHQTYAGWHLKHMISPAWQITYAVNFGKISKDSVMPTLNSPQSDIASPEASSSSLLLNQAASMTPETPSKQLFAEALVTVVYSWCSGSDSPG